MRPTIDVRLFRDPHFEWTCRALIDTGSPVTIFDYGASEALGVKIRSAGADIRPMKLMGESLFLQMETIELSLTAFPDGAWETQVGFITEPSFQMPFQGLLGTTGFLDRHAVTFNYCFGYFEVQAPDEAADAAEL